MEAIAGSVVSTLAGGLLGAGSSSSGGSEKQTVTEEPWEGIVPYLLGSEPGLAYTSPTRPINNDWMAWQYYASQGLPVGPPPPMHVDDPRYTGENVYDAPFTYNQPRYNVGYGDPYAQYGAPPGGLPPGDNRNTPPAGPPSYPSQDPNLSAPATPPPSQPAQPPAQAGAMRYSPVLDRMVAVDERGNVLNVDQTVEELNAIGRGFHINPRTGRLEGTLDYRHPLARSQPEGSDSDLFIDIWGSRL